jgi:serine/threonine-protein phosphatase 4 regulatory subunit 4
MLFCVQDYLTSDQIYDTFVPICFRYMSDGVLPVKISAALALAVFLRYSNLN